MPSPTPQLTESELARLAALADIILPRHGRMPSASQVELCAKIQATTFSIRPDLAESVQQVLALCPDLPAEEAVPHLASMYPKLLSALIQALVGTYYMQPEVRKLIAYHGQKRQIVD